MRGATEGLTPEALTLISEHQRSTLGTDGEHIAALVPKHLPHMAEEALLLRLGHQVQRGAGKAAAMHAVRAAIVQHVFGHGQRHAQGLLGAVLGVHVLQVHPAAAAGFNQDALDLVDLIGLDGIDQRVHAVVFIVIMQGAQQVTKPETNSKRSSQSAVLRLQPSSSAC